MKHRLDTEDWQPDRTTDNRSVLDTSSLYAKRELPKSVLGMLRSTIYEIHLSLHSRLHGQDNSMRATSRFIETTGYHK
jgi:hypothetical protein